MKYTLLVQASQEKAPAKTVVSSESVSDPLAAVSSKSVISAAVVPQQIAQRALAAASVSRILSVLPQHLLNVEHCTEQQWRDHGYFAMLNKQMVIVREGDKMCSVQTRQNKVSVLLLDRYDTVAKWECALNEKGNVERLQRDISRLWPTDNKDPEAL